jgi:hypothetical protein
MGGEIGHGLVNRLEGRCAATVRQQKDANHRE